MTKVIVYHSTYGCETGCCGHVVEFSDGSKGKFKFTHPYGTNPREFAEQLVRNTFGEEHVKDLDWGNCEVVND